MKPLGKMHFGLLALALLNMLPVVQVEASWGVWLIALFAAALSCVIARPDGGTRLPMEVIYGMICASSLYLLYEMFWPHDEPTVYIIDLAHFMIFLACCKFFELRTHRDAALVMVISGLLILISAFASASPIFAAVVIIDISFGVAWLLAFQTLREADRVLERRRIAWRAAGAGTPPSIMEWNRWTGGGSIGATSGCFLGLAVIGMMVFVAFPRGWGRGLFGKIQGVIPNAVTGFTDQIQLGDTPLLENETPVMRVRLRSSALGFKAEDQPLYLRGLTFERYDQGRWHPLRKSPRPVELAPDGSKSELSLLANTADPDRMIDQEISLENIGSGSLFSLYPPLTMASIDIKTAKLDQSDLAIQTDERPRGPIRYQVRSLAKVLPEEIAKLDPPPPRRTRPSSLSIIAPEVRQFAREFFARFGDPSDPAQRERMAQRVREHLSSGEYEYTLSRGRGSRGVDPIKDFLFDHKRGHCEYFASAMAVMCQAVDIPARLVNGYYGGDYNAVGGYHQFRQNDAHAWVEVYIPQRGWVIFDPSPATATLRATQEDGFLARSQRLAEYLQFKWSSLVAFDANSRYDLVEQFARALRKLTESADQGPATLSSSVLAFLWGPELLTLWQRFFYWLLIALCLVFIILTMRVLAILSLMIKERLPIGRRRRGGVMVRRPEARFYDRLLLLLANKGHVKPAHFSPREFAVDLARSHRDLAELPGLTDWYYEAQYGRRDLSRVQFAHIRTFLQRLREDAQFGTR
ncbi:MAG TPA: DUF3488 and transglutaminase-like domain-containing protein [Phycisphaerae bacterium]|nr:DUF3488 and transglutaminase-like domain-containing protein [Phycisphaerae bacterium]